MKFCAKCHNLFEEGTVCANCGGPLTEPKSGNLVLLTAAMHEESTEILNAFRAKGIFIDRQPAIEKGVFELFVQYDDWVQAKETLKMILEDMKKHQPDHQHGVAEELAQEKHSNLSNGKKWMLRIIAALVFGLLIWGVVALTDFAMSFIKEINFYN